MTKKLIMTKKFMLPFELVNIIADYHDYDKHCKPQHKDKFQDVISDIYSMGEIMPEIAPSIALQCWGNGITYKDLNDLADYETYWDEILDILDEFGDDDEVY